jgi:hypothetical protein
MVLSEDWRSSPPHSRALNPDRAPTDSTNSRRDPTRFANHGRTPKESADLDGTRTDSVEMGGRAALCSATQTGRRQSHESRRADRSIFHCKVRWLERLSASALSASAGAGLRPVYRSLGCRPLGGDDMSGDEGATVSSLQTMSNARPRSPSSSIRPTTVSRR